MAYLCLKCKEIYDNSITQIRKTEYVENKVKKEWLMCPKSNCFGDVVEIDDLMLPIIKTLNEKGYITEYCCSGHLYENAPRLYISFKCIYIFIKKESLSDFNIYDLGGRTVIEKYLDKTKNYKDLYNDILESNMRLLEYVDELPSIK